MPSFRKPSEALVSRFDELAALVPDAERRQMFGYPTCVLGGNMFMALHEECLVLRLSDEDRARFLAEHDAAIFEPMPGRPMREYVVVPEQLVGAPMIEQWVAHALEFARTLPPKKKPVRR